MKVFTGKELFDAFTGIDRSRREMQEIVEAPKVSRRKRFAPASGWTKVAESFISTILLTGGVLYLVSAEINKNLFHAAIGFMAIWLSRILKLSSIVEIRCGDE